MMAGAGASPYELASDAASRLGIAVGAEELAVSANLKLTTFANASRRMR